MTILDGGDVYIRGKKVRCPTPQAGIREGVAYLPEDRKTLGLIQGQSIRDNYALPSLDRLTSNYAEALEMSHRILVMRRGAVVRDFKRGEANEEDLLREAIGEVTNMAPAGPALAVSAVV